MSPTDILHVAFAADNNYKIPLMVSIISLVENAQPSTKYQVVVLVPDEFDKNATAAINKYLYDKGMPNAKFINMKDKYQNIEMKVKHITSPTYYRLDLPNLLDCDLCLYLDVDIAVQKDLSEFFKINMDDYYIAGVKAAFIFSTEQKNKKQCERVNIPSIESYINAGVVLMNLKKMREDNISERFIKALDYNFKLQDQDILNHVCFGHIKVLPPIYNSMTKYNNSNLESYDSSLHKCLKYTYQKSEWENACKNPIIIHYADKRKPWNTMSSDFADIWWKYALILDKYFPCLNELFSSIAKFEIKNYVSYQENIEALNKEKKDLKNKIAEQKEKYEALKKSKTYRIGRIVSSPVRETNRLYKKIFKRNK